MSKYFIRIGKVVIAFYYEQDHYTELLDMEYELIKIDETPEDIRILICEDHFRIPDNAECLSTDVWRKGDHVFQFFSAFMRSFWIEYYRDNEYVVRLYFPHNRSFSLFRIVSPFYLSKPCSCLSDFLHNLLFCALNDIMAIDGYALLHSACYKLKKYYCITGGPQIGKSSLLYSAVHTLDANYITEDFLYLSEDAYVFGLPHKSRVVKDKLRKYGYTRKGLVDWFNLSFYNLINKVLKKPNSARYMGIKNIYGGKYISQAKLDVLIYLTRNNSNNNGEEIFKSCITDIFNELNNMISYHKVIDVLKETGINQYSFNELITKYKSIYDLAFNEIQIARLDIPFFQTVDQAMLELNKQLGGNE